MGKGIFYRIFFLTPSILSHVSWRVFLFFLFLPEICQQCLKKILLFSPLPLSLIFFP
ncbi:MAG TPA: hypothetical protein VMC80_03865 [Patescibacteria group bacterium]|nr:hypothetical protein [Patescibacteria group bacterium]